MHITVFSFYVCQYVEFDDIVVNFISTMYLVIPKSDFAELQFPLDIELSSLSSHVILSKVYAKYYFH